jgi:hypothetical protein
VAAKAQLVLPAVPAVPALFSLIYLVYLVILLLVLMEGVIAETEEAAVCGRPALAAVPEHVDLITVLAVR